MADASAQIPAYVAIGISIGTLVLGIVNHKRIKSSCCGRTVDASFDIENTTPPQLKPPPPPLTSIPPTN
jgi:hypothetical protein